MRARWQHRDRRRNVVVVVALSQSCCRCRVVVVTFSSSHSRRRVVVVAALLSSCFCRRFVIVTLLLSHCVVMVPSKVLQQSFLLFDVKRCCSNSVFFSIMVQAYLDHSLRFVFFYVYSTFRNIFFVMEKENETKIFSRVLFSVCMVSNEP